MSPARSLAIAVAICSAVACTPPPPSSCEIEVDADATTSAERSIRPRLVLRDATGAPAAADGRLELWVETTRGDRATARCSLTLEVARDRAAGDTFFLDADLPFGCAQPVPEGLAPFVAEASFTPASGAPVLCFGRVADNIGGDRPSAGEGPLRPPPPPEPPAPPAPPAPPPPPPTSPPRYVLIAPSGFVPWPHVPQRPGVENLEAHRSTRVYSAAGAHVAIMLRTEIVPAERLEHWLEVDEQELTRGGVRLLSQEPTTSAGAPGVRWDVLGEQHGEENRMTSLTVLQGSRSYTLTCGSAAAAYAEWGPICDRVLRSFRVLEPR